MTVRRLRTSTSLFRRRERHPSPSTSKLVETPEVERRDIVAMIIALFQLFAPLVLALLGVGLIVSVILLNIR